MERSSVLRCGIECNSLGHKFSVLRFPASDYRDWVEEGACVSYVLDEQASAVLETCCVALLSVLSARQ